MSIPNLLHPVSIKIKQIDVASTDYDDDAREPIQKAAKKPVITVDGQVKWSGQQDVIATKGGAKETATGYVLFRRIDLNAQSVVLRHGDQIIQLGNIDADVYINRLEWTAHYEDQGGPTMVKAHFGDKQPARQTRGS